jgi:hypothetical protein
MSPTPLERLIDALQTAVLSAQAVERVSGDLTVESRRLVAAVEQMGRAAHALRTTTGGAK